MPRNRLLAVWSLASPRSRGALRADPAPPVDSCSGRRPRGPRHGPGDPCSPSRCVGRHDRGPCGTGRSRASPTTSSRCGAATRRRPTRGEAHSARYLTTLFAQGLRPWAPSRRVVRLRPHGSDWPRDPRPRRRRRLARCSRVCAAVRRRWSTAWRRWSTVSRRADPSCSAPRWTPSTACWRASQERRPAGREGRRRSPRLGDGAAAGLLYCHVDTVWPRGTLARWPFSADGGGPRAPGCGHEGGDRPGALCLSALGKPEGVRLLVTTDEEVGSPSSRALIEESGAGLEAVLVLEASYEGALKVARKGTAQYTVQIQGRAWHASEPAGGPTRPWRWHGRCRTSPPSPTPGWGRPPPDPGGGGLRPRTRCPRMRSSGSIRRAPHRRPSWSGSRGRCAGSGRTSTDGDHRAGRDRPRADVREISRAVREAQAVAVTSGCLLFGGARTGWLGRPVHRRHGHPHSRRLGAVGAMPTPRGSGSRSRGCRSGPRWSPPAQDVLLSPRDPRRGVLRPGYGAAASTPPAPSGTGPLRVAEEGGSERIRRQPEELSVVDAEMGWMSR